jgi:hypothetical protein
MAFKSFKSLTTRNQSSLITQLHKLINYYGDTFCPRERNYLKNLSSTDGSIYWLEDDNRKMVAVALVDPNYIFEADGITVRTLGYTISRRQGQMDRILSHIWSDYEEDTIGLFSRKSLVGSLDLEFLNLIELTPLELDSVWPQLAQIKSDYFNLSSESLVQGLSRKDYNLYVRFSPKDLASIEKKNKALFDLCVKKKAQMTYV